jgi:hypothetical protein
MAFLRYVISSSATNSAVGLNAIFADIVNWVGGSITATSGFTSSVCNIASSEIQGTIPTNVYTAVKNSNTASNSDNQLYITKYHSDWSSYNTSHPVDRLYLIWTHSSGTNARMRIANTSGANMMPYPGTSLYHAGSTTTGYVSAFGLQQTTIFVWLEQDYMAMQLVDSNVSDAIFIGSFDQPRSEYAEWAFSQDPQFPCAYTISNLCNGTYNNTVVPTLDWFYAGTHDYYDESGANQAYPPSYSAAEDFGRGWSASDNSSVGNIYPVPYKVLPQIPITGGVGHQLVPVFSDSLGGNATSANYPIRGRLKGIFRTSDNFAPTGTEIVYGGNTYRVCMMHKCGSSSTDAQNILNACYLLRVTV